MSDNKQQNSDSEGLVEIVDLEQVTKSNGKPPKAKSYRLRIDDKYYVVQQASMTGAELLKLAGQCHIGVQVAE